MRRTWRRAWKRGKLGFMRCQPQQQAHKAMVDSFTTRLTKKLLPAAAAAGIFFSTMTGVHANPAGGTVTTGTGSITGQGTANVTINQTSDKLGINWNSFSIASGEKVQFIQPRASSIALNRVLGNNASTIYGQLTANGKVFLINPNGILFAKGAQVNVGGLVASTLNISDSDFIKGKYIFSGDSKNNVINQGTITAAKSGYVALLASQVSNEGVIIAKQSTAALGAGSKVALDFTGDGLLTLSVDKSAVNAQATNSGLIQADGGLVVMSALTADALAGTVVNNSGTIEARSVNNANGVIRLEGGTNGTVSNSGTLDASGQVAGQTGGTVKVLGDKVTLAKGTTIDASGTQGGGTILVGGNYQGSGSEQHATTTTVDDGAAMNADAITGGNGGKVVVWADGTTNFAGTITAQGGSAGGNGGQVETSGKQTLNIADTASVNTLAAKGTNGSWLLDLATFTIGAGGNMSIAALTGALASSDVTITTTGANSATVSPAGSYTASAGNGDITLSSPLAWHSSSTLTLNSYNGININETITANQGGLTLKAAAGGIITAEANISIGGIFDLKSGTWNQVPSGFNQLPSFYAYDFRISGGTFIRAKSGNGVSPYIIGDVYGLQGMGSSGMLNKFFMLDGNIDASGTQNWYYGCTTAFQPSTGFVPIGDYYNKFTGSLIGNGNTISGLFINRPQTYTVGLFGAATGSIQAVRVAGGNITGGDKTGGLVGEFGYTGYSPASIIGGYYSGSVSGGQYVGGLVGDLYNGSLKNCNSDATVSGVKQVGGLAGAAQRNTTIELSTSKGTVTGAAGGEAVGGLVGEVNGGSISTSSSASAVTGGTKVGGLIGNMMPVDIGSTLTVGSITDCHSTGNVQGTGGYVGGLVGNNEAGDITTCYSTGDVQAAGAYVGGLVGHNRSGNITTCYSSGAVTSTTGNYIGGLAGDNLSGNVTSSYSTSKVRAFGSYVGGLIGYNGGSSIDSSYHTTGIVEGFNSVGGLVGETGGNITNSYNISDVGGRDNVGGLAGQATGSVSDCYHTGAVSGSSNVGGLVGKMLGQTITASHSDGVITGKNYVGGLVGYNSSSIRYSCSTGKVQGNGGMYDVGTIGGLVGLHYSGTIDSSYSTSNVIGSNSLRVGGLVGRNQSSIINSYSTGTVAGGWFNGGLVGDNVSNIINSYSTGTVAGLTYVGGLVGGSFGQIYNSYSTGTGDLKKQASSYVSWDFDNTWRIYEGYTYPLLKYFLKPLTVTATAPDISKAYDGKVAAYTGTVTYPTGSKPAEVSDIVYNGGINVGTYTPGIYSSQQGYDITFNNTGGTLTIGKADLSVKANDATKTYDGLAYSGGNGVTYSGLVNSETESVLSGSLTYGGNSQGAKNANSYSITPGGLTSGNYSITYADGTLTIGKGRPERESQ